MSAYNCRQVYRKVKGWNPSKIQGISANKKSARRDSNSIIAEKANKIKEERTLSTVCLQAVYILSFMRKGCQDVCGADTSRLLTAGNSGRNPIKIGMVVDGNALLHQPLDY